MKTDSMNHNNIAFGVSQKDIPAVKKACESIAKRITEDACRIESVNLQDIKEKVGNLFCIVCYLFKFCVINHFDGNCTNIITLIFEQKAGYTAVKTAGQGNGDFTLIGQNIPHLHLLKCIQYIRWFLLNPVLS